MSKMITEREHKIMLVDKTMKNDTTLFIILDQTVMTIITKKSRILAWMTSKHLKTLLSNIMNK